MTASTATGAREISKRLTTAGVLLGLGLGGFIDGIVLHQILQWHHMGTHVGSHASFPASTIESLKQNTTWDGLFHVATWVFVAVGLYMWVSVRRHPASSARLLTGLLLMGWGLFNLVEGIVDHHILGIHHVRDDLGAPLSWDLAFLAFGVVLLIVGDQLRRRALK